MARTQIESKCPACGSELSREGTCEGLCQACLIQLALESPSLLDELESPDEEETQAYSREAFAPGRILGGRYRIHSLLGRGGMGEVWRATDLKLRVDVALKALRRQLHEEERALETLRQEVRAAREVISPNVCRVFDLVELEGQELVSMEYIDGITLLDILKMRAPLDLAEARDIAAQFLAGLEAIHNAGLVHRDVKPENLMMTRSGRVVLMDFGIAKGLGDRMKGTVSGTPAYMAPEQSRGEMVDARADVFSAGVVLAEMIAPGGLRSFEARQKIWQGIHHEPPEIAESPWTSVLTRAVAGHKEQRYATASALTRALEEVTLRVAGAEDIKPYPGLASFTEADAEYFFGRELEVEAMWKKLQRPHLLGLIGASGTGKSSFLRAGLLPVIPSGWRAVIMAPGGRPMLALGQALAEEVSGDLEAVRDLLRFDEMEVAVSVITRWRQQHEHALLIVDQFEELFTQNPPEVQERFSRLLSRLGLEADVHVLLSMRDDFLGFCSLQESLAPIFSELTPLKPLTGVAVRRALVQPGLKCGYRFEDESLVDEMVAEVSDERGALPLLAFAASRLWDHRDREQGLLTREAYEHIGGVGGALAQHAEATLEKIGEYRIPIVRELFRNLVTAQGTRAARDREELLSVFGEGAAAAEEVLNTLVDARLLTSYEVPAADEDETTHHRIEIIHESLLSNWPRLVRWQTQDADSAQLRDQIRQAAQMWEERGRPDDLLWTGTSFGEYRLWRERYLGGLSTAEEAFGAAMIQRAEGQRRRRRVALAATLVLLLTVLAIVAGFWRRSVAEARRAEAAKLLAMAQLRQEEDPTEALAFTTASLELADTEAARIFALRLLWAVPPALEVESQGDNTLGTLGTASFSPDGDRLAAAGVAEAVRVWTAAGGPPLVLPGHESVIQENNHARWESNELLVTGLLGGVARWVHLWAFPAGERVRTIDFGAPALWQVGDSRLLAEVIESDPQTGQERYHHLRSWQLPDGGSEELGTIDARAHDGSFSAFDFDGHGWIYGEGRAIFYRPLPMVERTPDHLVGSHLNEVANWRLPAMPERLWTRDASSGELRLWNLAARHAEPLRVVPPPASVEPGTQLSPSPDGRWVTNLVTPEGPVRLSDYPSVRNAQLWDLSAWAEARPLTLRRSGSWFLAAATFHPRGDWMVASTHSRSRLTFWPLLGDRPWVVEGYSSKAFRPLQFSPDSRWLATTWPPNDSLRLWPLPGSGTREITTLPLPARSGTPLWRDFVFDPQGRFVLVGAYVDIGAVVPLDGSPPTILEAFSNETALSGMAVSPSGLQVAMAFRAGDKDTTPRTLMVWNLETGDQQELELPEAVFLDNHQPFWNRGVFDLAFADESTLYTSGVGGLRRWNLATGTHELVLSARPRSTLMWTAFGPNARTAFILDPIRGDDFVGPARILDLATGEVGEISAFAKSAIRSQTLWPRNAFDATESVAAIGDREGIIRVARLSGGEPHLLVGHEGPIDFVAISPDGRWIASTGEDNTLRLWPMPDLDRPPLHTLPLDELVAKLMSLTNIRVVRDPESAEGWKVALDPFPGWAEVPTW